MGAASSQCVMGETPMGLMPTIKKIGFEIAVLLLIFGYSAHYYFEVAALPSRKINLLLIQPVFFVIAFATIALIFIKIREVLKSSAQRKSLGLSHDNSGQHIVETIKGGIDRAFLKNGLALAICTLTYVLVFERLGFVTSSLLYLTVLIFLLGSRSLWMTIFLPIIVVAFLYITMAVMLRFSLPEGLLF